METRDGVKGLFPGAVSSSPILLNSAGPATVSEECYSSWRRVFEQLTEEGYLSSFHESEDRLSIGTDNLTSAGSAFFHPVTEHSIFWFVRLAAPPEQAPCEIVQIKRKMGTKRATMQFRSPTSRPFDLMRQNNLFTPACRGEFSGNLNVDSSSIFGHAHLRYRKGQWGVERVVFGAHRPKE